MKRITRRLLIGLPLAFVGVLAVEALAAGRGEYAPDDPGFVVDAAARPAAGGATGAPLRLVMLGDSTVAGLGATSAEGSLAVQTAQRAADELGRDVHVTGLGVSGARTADVASDQVPQLVDGEYDVVVIVIGSNDVTHATPPWRFDDETRQMLTRAVEAGGGAPVVLGGIPLFGSATALAQPLRGVVDLYAKPLRRIQSAVAAQVDGVTFVDIAAEASPRFAGVPDAMSPDGFHPADKGYGFWADALAPAVTRLAATPR